MKTSLEHPNFHLLSYEIREIVDLVQKLKEINPDFQIENENIGDPIAKGWPVPPFLKTLLKEEIDKEGDASFGYTHSRGAIEVRKWISSYAKKFCPKINLDFEDVLITSGLGAAISIMYQMLPPGGRVLQPSPTYPTHAAMEAFSSGQKTITYSLDPWNKWEPNLAEMEEKLQKHPEILAILIINPNNPTGSIYSKESLEGICALAEKYNVMIFSDEIYFRMTQDSETYTHISEIALGKVPLIVMRGLSKDMPWPGGRCGWLEFHNVELSTEFSKYAEAIKKRVLMEVCSTHLPQIVMPKVYEHPEFEAWLKSYNSALAENSEAISKILSTVPELHVNKTLGAFYMMPVFKTGVLNSNQSLKIENPEMRKLIEEKVSAPGLPLDKRFIYYLLAATGICAVPASGFSSPHAGFRITTLTRDPQKRDEIYTKLRNAINEYLAS